ncbi:hypothetical protein AB0B65_30940, partial [Micromonospora parva]
MHWARLRAQLASAWGDEDGTDRGIGPRRPDRREGGRPGLRALYLNQVLVSGLIMATEPLLA